MKQKILKTIGGSVIFLSMIHAAETPIQIYTTLTTKTGLVIKGTNKGLVVENNTTFNVPNLEFNNTKNAPVYALAEQKDGKIIIGGNFDTVNEYPQNDLVRINKDGSLDESFTAKAGGFDGEVYDIKVLENKNIIVGGHFSKYDSTTNLKGLIKFNQYGIVNNTYNILRPYDNGVVTNIKKLGSKLYLAGSFIKIKKMEDGAKKVTEKPVLLLNKYGLNNKFNKNMSHLSGTAFKIVKDKKSLVIVGDFESTKNSNITNIIKVSKNGKIRKSFNTKVDGIIFDAKIKNNTLNLYGDFVHKQDIKNAFKIEVANDTIVKDNVLFDSGKFGKITGAEKKQFTIENIDENTDFYTSRCTPIISIASSTRKYWYGKQKAYTYTRVHSCGRATYISNYNYLASHIGHILDERHKKRYNTNYLKYVSTHWFKSAFYLFGIHNVSIGGRVYRKESIKRF